MLQNLSIQNYALIHHLDLPFRPNFTTITGETGSGKSILLGALGLILGERADSSVLKDKAHKCVVEGSFELSDYDHNYSINNFFVRHDLDYDSITTIRREITTGGRSRAFINDTPVTLAQLKELTSQLVDIHSQHETLTLNNSEFQLSVVDAYAGNNPQLAKYHELFRTFKEKDRKLAELVEQESRSKLDLDYFQFQCNELEEADLKAGEEKLLEAELETLANAENIKVSLNNVVAGFRSDDNNVMDILNEIRQSFRKISGFTAALGTLNERLNSATVELEDIASELEQMEEQLTHDPQRMQIVNDRLDLLNGLLVKHRVDDTNALMALHDELDEKLQGIGSIADQIGKLQAEIEADKVKLNKMAGDLSAKRKKAIPAIVKNVHTLLAQMAMPHAGLEIQCDPLEAPAAHGLDRIQFMFKANKGGDFKELGKVASGGELSRLMLSIKALMANLKTLPTIILDEIDTGISGDVADKAGNIMKTMAEGMQVICITHLPQIASKGDHHLRVFKEVQKDTTITQVSMLDEEERVSEIAKMLSGENMSEAAVENARVLLGV